MVASLEFLQSRIQLGQIISIVDGSFASGTYMGETGN